MEYGKELRQLDEAFMERLKAEDDQEASVSVRVSFLLSLMERIVAVSDVHDSQGKMIAVLEETIAKQKEILELKKVKVVLERSLSQKPGKN